MGLEKNIAIDKSEPMHQWSFYNPFRNGLLDSLYNEIKNGLQNERGYYRPLQDICI